MDDLESFKAARLKMDPTARKMSAGQWERAYEAHLRAKERVGGGRSSARESHSGGDGEGASREGRSRSGSLSHRGNSRRQSGDTASLRRRVREHSAYGDLRLIIDVLAWVATAVLILTALVPLFFNTPIPVSLIALLNAVMGVISVIVTRLLAQMLIDIPDIALYRLVNLAPPEGAPISPNEADV